MDARIKRLAAALALAAATLPALANDVVVIGNKDNANSVDKALIAKLYTGDARSWPDGGQAVLFDQPDDNQLRGIFYTTVVGRSPAQAKAAWAQLTFSGKATPPKVVDGDAEVKRAVAANKNAVGYIKATSVDDSVKVLLK
ncbi:MAG: substrate-binding domain-containing protein [Burkholderiales bacterium]